MVAAKLMEIGPEGRQRVDRYELVAEIASGGMATVYLARLSGMGGFQRFLAIKRLHPHLAGEREFVEMFLDEARLAAQIHHPNVVPIQEVGASERGYYLVMEYIEGDTLARLLARAATSGTKLPNGIGIRIIIDMLNGLHAAHELRDEHGNLVELVHRDVSPQNVLVGIDGASRITDFGVARAEARLSNTRVGQLKGKIAYMAPEQAAGAPSVDRRADVFSAGIVLWEVLAARRLFKAENEAATLSRVVSEPIPRVAQIAPEVSLRINSVVMKALERDVDKRYATCREFSDALEEAAHATSALSTQREVATYVADVLGNDIAAAREAVRGWLARSEPSQVAQREGVPPTAAAGSVSNAALEVPGDGSSGATALDRPRSAPPGAARSRVPLFAAAALGLLFVGGMGVFLATRSSPSSATQPAPKGAEPPSAKPAAKPDPAPATPPAVASAEPAASAAPVDARPAAPKPGFVGSPNTRGPRPSGTGPKAGGDVDMSNPYR